MRCRVRPADDAIRRVSSGTTDAPQAPDDGQAVQHHQPEPPGSSSPARTGVEHRVRHARSVRATGPIRPSVMALGDDGDHLCASLVENCREEKIPGDKVFFEGMNTTV